MTAHLIVMYPQPRDPRTRSTNPGFPDELRVRAPLRTLTRWWRGDVSLPGARAEGMTIEGRRDLVQAFPTFFDRYLLAEVAPAKGGAARAESAPPPG
jgi:hypothetical protein